MSIATSLQKVLDSKEAIKTSINNKGGQITSATPFSAYSAAIDNLPSGGGGDGMVKSLSESEFTGNVLTKCINVITGVTTPSGVTSYGEGAFDGFISLKRLNSNTDGVFNLPSGMTTLPNLVFRSCNSMEEVNFPSGITTIGNSCFQYCEGLKSVTLPSSLTGIGTSVFNWCSNLESVIISNGVKTIGSNSFSYCYKLSSVTIPDSVTSIGSAAFQSDKALKTIHIPVGCYVGDTCFEGSGIESVTIPSGVSMSSRMFNICSALTSVTLSEGVKQVGGLGGTAISSIVMPNSISGFAGNATFGGCTALTSVTLSESLSAIPGTTFQGCSSLPSITFPSGITTIDGYYTFSGCTSLAMITCLATTPPNIGSGTFYQLNNVIQNIYVPAESVEAYQTATNWSTFASRIQAIPTA